MTPDGPNLGEHEGMFLLILQPMLSERKLNCKYG
jgi:hypothetical protein